MLIDKLREKFASPSHAHRFRRASDWLRLSVLGGVVLCFSVFALADEHAPGAFVGEGSGTPAIFSGAAIILFVAKIGRGELYFDWIISGGLYVCVGFSLVAGKDDHEILAQILFCVLLMASGIARIWIGLKIEPRTSRDWFYCSGGLAVTCGFVALSSWTLGAPSPSQNIIALDILILGVSILGFGLDLSEAR